MIEVVAAIIIKNNCVLIARRAASKSFPGKWEFPVGKVENREGYEDALKRELHEEFGIEVSIGNYLYTNEHDYGKFQIKLFFYFVKHIGGDFHLKDHDKIEWVRISDVLTYDMAEADIPVIEKIIHAFQ
jgi:8-oxo-dGTP diphosphatase